MDEKYVRIFSSTKFIDYFDVFIFDESINEMLHFFWCPSEDERKILQNYSVEIAIFYVFIHRFWAVVFLIFIDWLRCEFHLATFITSHLL